MGSSHFLALNKPCLLPCKKLFLYTFHVFIFLVAWCLFIACLLFQSSPPCFCTAGGGHTEDDKETEADMKNVAGKLVI